MLLIKILEWVAAQQADLGIAIPIADDPAVGQDTLVRFKAVCALLVGHCLQKRSVIQPEDLEDEPFISLSSLDRLRDQIDAIFDQVNVQRRIRLDPSLTEVACAMVSEGLGVAIVDPLTARQFVTFGVISVPFDPAVFFDIKLLRPLHRPRSRIVDVFIAELKHSAGEIV